MSGFDLSGKIFINTLSQFGSKGISVLLSLVSVGLLTRYLGTEGYGNFTLVFTYISLFAVLSDIGFNQLVVREFAGGVEKSEKIKASFLNIKFLLTILAILLPILVLPFFPYSNFIKIAIIIGTFAVASGNMVSYGTSLLQARLRLDLVALLDLAMKIVSVIVIVLFIKAQLNLYYIIGAVFIGNIVGLVSVFAFVRQQLVFKLYIDINLAKRLLKLGIPVGISAFLAVLYFKVDTLMLSIFRSPTEVGIYGLSFKLFDNILMLWGLYMASVYPLLSKFYLETNPTKYKILIKNTLLVLLCLSLIIIFCGYAFTPFIMRILGGSKFFSSMLPFKILLLATPFFFLNSIFYYIILSFGKTKYLLLPLGLSLIFNIFMNLYAIPRFGYIGTSYITVITELFTSIFYIVILLSNFRSKAIAFINS
jgi:O-antigen/teichoic acid export membrane protein